MLVCVSLDHRRASFDLLGEVERHTTHLTQALADTDLSRGSVVLATCNRFEAYLDVPSLDSVDRALDKVSGVTGIHLQELHAASTIHHNLEAATHLFSVASGLESVVLGEGEIAGQVRRALEQARASGSTTSKLERVFQLAARTSRDVKNRTGVQTAGRSLVRLALTMAQSRIGDWASATTLLVGTGMYAGASLAALRARGAEHVSVYSPSGRAAAFAESHGIRAVAESELDAALASADLVITTSLAQDPILHADVFARTARPARAPYCSDLRGHTEAATSSRTRPRLVIDLGLPRNVAPDVARLPGIELLDLDLIAQHAPLQELSAEAEARDIVDDSVREFAALQAEQDAVPALVALRGSVHDVLYDELERVRTHEDPDRAAAVEAALRHFTGRLLHAPSLRIRQMGRDGEAGRAIAAVESLFGESPRATASHRS